MVTKNGHYILSINDWNTICKHFTINPRDVYIVTYPDLLFIEYALIDIRSGSNVLSFYDHDGMIRIIDNGKTLHNLTSSVYGANNMHEISINDILCSNPSAPSTDILNIIKSKTNTTRPITKQVAETVSSAVKSVTKSDNNPVRKNQKK